MERILSEEERQDKCPTGQDKCPTGESLTKGRGKRKGNDNCQ